MDRATSDRIWHDSQAVRRHVEDLLERHPELFPKAMRQGFFLCGKLPQSQKLAGVCLRRVRVTETDEDSRATTQDYFLRPSFVLPYCRGTVDDVEKGMMLLTYNVPYHVVQYCFGHNAMYWYRLEQSLGRNSLVGTTVRAPDALPPHLAADEHHAQLRGADAYVAMTAGGGCVLGMALSNTASEVDLTAAYGRFRDEAADVSADSAPETVNTDGWKATQAAWRALYPKVVVILCFFHGFLKIRDRCRKAFELHGQVWEVYRATSAPAFRAAMESFRQWCAVRSWSGPIQEALEELWSRTEEYVLSYTHPACHRTSNAVDRPMNALYRLLYADRTLHGHLKTAEWRLRGWALLRNFRPFERQTQRRTGCQSAAHRLNKMKYHDNWLHNLYISASLGGCRA
ncbi:MAG: hypothetical protein JOZ63_07585 [Planctomycetaceae bacterium]|nr:hypothetical protein [Planctomycetaceae bacterium]